MTYGYRYEYKKIHQENNVAFSNQATVEAIVSFSDGKISANNFITVSSGYKSGAKEYIRGEVELDQIKKWAAEEGVSVLLAPQAGIVPQELEKYEWARKTA